MMQAQTGAGSGAPHKGLVEELVEKAREYLPHQLTGAAPHPTTATDSLQSGSTGSAYPAYTPTYTRVSCRSHASLKRDCQTCYLKLL